MGGGQDQELIIQLLNRNLFDPTCDSEKKLPDGPGVYVVCARSMDCLPHMMRGLSYNLINGLPVIYVGIAGQPTSRKKSLRKRDYRNHFCGNARGSTLRKSLGVLYGDLQKEQNNRDIGTNRFKFIKADEEKLSSRMKNCLVLHYVEDEEPIKYEQNLIKHFEPPLNIKDNHSVVNKEFRDELVRLRKFNTWEEDDHDET